MRNAKWIGVVLTAAMAGSLTACSGTQGSSAVDSSAAASTTATDAETGTAAAAKTDYAVVDDHTGLAVREWVSNYAKLGNGENSYVWLSSGNLDGSVSYGCVEGYVVDLPENFDENAEDAYKEKENYTSYYESNYVCFSEDENVTEDDIKAAIENTFTGDYTLTSFTTESGKTMYEFSAGEESITYSEAASEETKALFADLQKEWDEQKAEFDIVNYDAASGISFSALDYNGNKVDESIFKNAKLTMVNLWGTGCSPCIAEMPDLQKLNDTLDDVQVITIVEDVTTMNDTECLEEAHDIMSTQGVTLTVLLGSKKLDEIFSWTATPTSYLVDENGNIVGRPNVGMSDYDTYAAWIQDAMAQLN